jgi:hypothetical protein
VALTMEEHMHFIAVIQPIGKRRKMKLTIITLLLTFIAILALDTGAVFAQGDKEAEKPQFREESMRKFEVANTAVQLNKGTMWVYNFGTITLHAYETKDYFGTFVFILEKEGKAVLLESPPVRDNYEELIDYIVGLGHTSIDLIVSYHPIGATFIKTDKLKFTNVYSMQHAVDNYTTGPGAPSLIGLKNQFGELFDATIYKPTVMLKEGKKEIAGITFEMTNVDFAFDVAIPGMNIVHPHMLGHDKHTLVFSPEFLDAAIAQLKRYQEKGYDMIISSHAEPETRGDVSIKLRYLQDLKVAIAESSNKDEFLAQMKAAYPGFGWPFYLQGSANFLFVE